MLSVINERRGKTRFDSIAELTGLEKRIVSTLDRDKVGIICESNVDFIKVYDKLNPYINLSKKWLYDALSSQINEPSVDELMRWKIISLEKKIKDLESLIKK